MSRSEGVVRLVSIDGVAAATSVDIVPDAGCDWTIIFCYGYHDDNAGAHGCGWKFTETNPERTGSPLVITFPTASIAQNLNMDIHAWRPDVSVANMTKCPESVVLTHNVKATFTADAMGAAKKLYIRAMVCERRGIGS